MTAAEEYDALAADVRRNPPPGEVARRCRALLSRPDLDAARRRAVQALLRCAGDLVGEPEVPL